MADVTKKAIRTAAAGLGLGAEVENAWAAAKAAREASRTAGDSKEDREGKTFAAAVAAMPIARQAEFSAALGAALSVSTGTPSNGGNVVPPPDPAAVKAAALSDASSRAETAREATRQLAEKAKEMAREAKISADEAEKLAKGSDEAKAARAAAEAAATAATEAPAPDNAWAQLGLATTARNEVRNIVRANGDETTAKNRAGEAENARDAAQGFEEQARNAANDAANALDDLKRRLGDTGSTTDPWKHFLERPAAMVAYALAAGFAIWGFFTALPWWIPVLMLLIILAGAATAWRAKPDAVNNGSAIVSAAVVMAIVLFVAPLLGGVGVNLGGNTGGSRAATDGFKSAAQPGSPADSGGPSTIMWLLIIILVVVVAYRIWKWWRGRHP